MRTPTPAAARVVGDAQTGVRNRTAVLLALVLASATAEGQTTWRGLVVAPEERCSAYRSDDYAYPQSLEEVIARDLGGVYSPYTGQCFATTWETDIEHIVARSEAHDSGLCAAPVATRRQFASDPLNLTLADPALNRDRKGAKDAAEWLPAQNRCWFAARVVQVRQKYGLTIDRREAAMLERVLVECPTVTMTPPACQGNMLSGVPPPDFSGPFDMLLTVWRAVRPYLGW